MGTFISSKRVPVTYVEDLLLDRDYQDWPNQYSHSLILYISVAYFIFCILGRKRRYRFMQSKRSKIKIKEK